MAVAILLFFLLKGKSPFGKNNTSFAVEPGTEITKIELLQGEKKLELIKSGDNWLINGETETRKNAVLFMIRSLKELKIKSPVSPDIFSIEITKKEVIPVKVKVYEKRKEVKRFCFYKTTSNIYGNIMKMRESSKPFIVYTPDHEDNISVSFTLNELYWEPYIVFNLMPSRIASVKLENFTDPSSSFIINNKKSGFQLSDLNKDLAGWDSSKVMRYFTYYTMIPFETWAFELSGDEKKRIESEPPLFKITVDKTKGGQIVLTIWEKWFNENGLVKKDTDRVWAKTDSRDNIFIMRYFDLDPILKKKSYFFAG